MYVDILNLGAHLDRALRLSESMTDDLHLAGVMQGPLAGRKARQLLDDPDGKHRNSLKFVLETIEIKRH